MKARRNRPNAALLAQAELAAERTVSALRVLVAFALLIVMLLVLDEELSELQDYMQRQMVFALGSIFLYLLFGIWGLWMVKRAYFKRWMIWPTATLDCVFVLANSLFSLENMAVPGALTFLLPSAWTIPVVLGFVLLRFNPYLLAYCAGILVVGHAFFVFDSHHTVAPQVRERVVVLVDAAPNIARLAMIGLAGVILVVAAAALRNLLHRALIETEARLSLTRYLPERLAERAEDLEGLRQGQRQNMGVMFVDIRGFTAWSENRDPSDVASHITAFRSRVARATRETGGLSDKFIGDGAMVLFEGAAAADRALRCVAHLLREMGQWSSDLQGQGEEPVYVGIGLHWGEVFSGVVGSEDRLEFTALGDTVNTAARLEQETKGAEVAAIASAAVFEAAGVEPAREGWSALPPVHLRGRNEPVVIFGRGDAQAC